MKIKINGKEHEINSDYISGTWIYVLFCKEFSCEMRRMILSNPDPHQNDWSIEYDDVLKLEEGMDFWLLPEASPDWEAPPHYPKVAFKRPIVVLRES